MLTEAFLLDNFSAHGNDIAELYKMIEAMEEVTSIEKILLPNIAVLSVDNSDDEAINFYRLTPNNIYTDVLVTGGKKIKTFKSVSLKKKNVLKKGLFEGVLKEADSGNPLMEIAGAPYFTSKNIYRTLSARISFKGDFILENCLERDLGITRCFENSNKIAALTIRNINGVKKIFSFLSEAYTYIPQTILSDIIESFRLDNRFGEVQCLYWNLDHFITEVYILFPEKAKEFKDLYGMPDNFIPGVYLATGGTGDSSLKIRGVWQVGKSIITQSEVIQKHAGKIDISEIMEDVDSKIFDEYAKLPDALCKLMNVEVSDAEYNALGQDAEEDNEAKGNNIKLFQQKEFEIRNKKRLTILIQEVFKKLGFVEAITKTREKELREQFLGELDLTEHFTAFDMVIRIMELPERINGLGKIYEEPFSKVCCKAAYLDYEALMQKIIEKTEIKSKKITLE